MKRSSIVILVLTITLIVSNVWQIVGSIDLGVRYTYLNARCNAKQIAIQEAIAILPLASDPQYSKENILRAAASIRNHKEFPREKDGYIWLYGLRLRFNESGRIIEAGYASPSGMDLNAKDCD